MTKGKQAAGPPKRKLELAGKSNVERKLRSLCRKYMDFILKEAVCVCVKRWEVGGGCKEVGGGGGRGK